MLIKKNRGKTGEEVSGIMKESKGRIREKLKKIRKGESEKGLSRSCFEGQYGSRTGYCVSCRNRDKDFEEDGPGPGAYSVSIVEKKKGGVIGKSKRNELVCGIDGPGPGAYENVRKAFVPSWSFKMGKKKEVRENTPGPGMYETAKLSPGIAHSAPKAKKNTTLQGNFIPGPGAYSTCLFSSTKYTIGKSKRTLLFSETCTPGPGDYELVKPSHSPIIKFSKQIRILTNPKINTPGPSDYTPKTILKSSSFSFTKAPKISIFSKHTKKRPLK